ncbi:hypothetical protein XI03_04270 [Bradyrhizobium sp. CCBAU 65884]|uniref:hypothetical protein n=1 Tax=Bradyrhizobium sp. CCBAU 65884 TaxID=722477 RepID=UPI0023068E8F|nr:hypothetical protein [Bradyrhizobium sp. CCBAU 65884]MDA9473740.1 hypothetical protein [Bradyrhizobium sp. CCBAU 65884]
MESASVPDTNDPKPDTGKPDAPKPNEVRADGGLAQAYDRIKSAEQDLARLDRLVSGMERESESPRASRASAVPTAATTPGDGAPKPDARVPSPYVPNSRGRDRGLKNDPAMMRALVILVLAIGLLGAAVASQYRDEAQSIGQSIMARWAPPAASTPPQASAVENPVQPPVVLLAAADEPSPVTAPLVPRETDSAPKPDAPRPDAPRPDAPRPGATAPDPSSSDLAQSLKSITTELASINGKLEQLKSRSEQTLREQADTIQQLKTAQEKDAADNARLAAQVQALQTQLTASSASSAPAAAKPVVRSVVSNDSAARARAHVPDAAPRRPRPPPRGPWMPPPYDPYYGDPDW